MTIPKSISEDDKLLSTSEVAKRCKVHRSTVHLWIKHGLLKTEKHGNFHAIRPSALKRFLSIYESGMPKGEAK